MVRTIESDDAAGARIEPLPAPPPPAMPGAELDPWWLFAKLTVGTLCRGFFRLHVHGLSNVPATGGAVIAPNHVSVLDPIPIGVALVERGRAIRYLVLTEDYARPVVGWCMKRIGQIPVRRGMGDWAAIRQISAAVKAGALAGIFPEGTVGQGYPLGVSQKGAARVALAARVPIIPVGVWGTNLRWGKAGLDRSGPIRRHCAIAFGTPIPPEGDATNRKDVRALTDRTMAEIDRLVVAARGRVERALRDGR